MSKEIYLRTIGGFKIVEKLFLILGDSIPKIPNFNNSNSSLVIQFGTTVSDSHHSEEFVNSVLPDISDILSNPFYQKLLNDQQIIKLTDIKCTIAQKVLFKISIENSYLCISREDTVQAAYLPFIENVLLKLDEHFEIVNQTTINDELFNELQQQNLTHYEKKLEDLSEISKSLTKSIAESSEVITKHITEQELTLRERFNKKEEELLASFSEKDNSLITREEKLRTREKEINDKEHRIVRRDLLEDIREVVDAQNEIKLSSETEKKAKNVIVLSSIAIGVSLVLIVVAVSIILVEKSIGTKTGIVLGSGSTLFVSSFIYLLKWLNWRYSAHANIEFFNKKFKADILRASWIAELAMEWKQDGEQKEMPETLIESFTTNLFINDKNTKDVNHPYDDLLKMTNKFSKVKFAKGMVEIESKTDKESPTSSN